MKTDVVVLGGGIIGCAVAEELARRGRRVVVVERGTVGAEASSAAAGILSAQMDLPEPGPLFEFCQAARRMYPRWVAHLEQRSGISVEHHVDGILYLAMNGREEQAMERRARWQRRLGLRVDCWSPKEVRRHEPSIDGDIRRGFHFPAEAQVDNAILMRALAVVCRKAGVDVREQTTVRRLLIRRRTVQGVDTDRGALRAPVIVNCLGSWGSLRGRFPVPVPVEPVRGQMLAFDGPKRLFRRAVMSERAYVVQRRDGRLLVGSTIEHVGFNKALTADGMQGILYGMQRMSSALNQCAFREAWSGLRPYTQDALPIIGSTSVEGLYVATGHFRHGILLAPITATVVAELVLRGRASVDLSPFSPNRFHPKK